jgi:FAD/FMN-containing dehydrogenase
MASVTRRPTGVSVTGAAAVLAPASVDDVRTAMHDAIAAQSCLRIAGAGTWPNAGPALHDDRTLSLDGMRGITEYVPGDLTLTARAGTSLAELSHATAANGQWLGLDPHGDRRGTIGATIATASAGPLSHAFGTPRDLVLGLEAVTGYGDVVRPGGRVVKNVAGFDLVRLYTGSWGTLGPITSVTLRLRAIPVHDVTLVMPVPDHTQLAHTISALRRNTIALLACEWLNAAAAARCGLPGDADVILLRVGGNDALVRGQLAALRTIAPCHECAPGVWSALALLDRDANIVARYSGSITDVPQRIARIAPRGSNAVAHATLSRGVVRVIETADGAAVLTALPNALENEQRIIERATPHQWASEHDAFADGLAGRIRLAFDPHLLCNRRMRSNG